MSVKDFERAEDDYQKDTKDYSDKISEYSVLKTDPWQTNNLRGFTESRNQSYNLQRSGQASLNGGLAKDGLA